MICYYRAALQYYGQLVFVPAVDPAHSGVTSDGHQATRPHLSRLHWLPVKQRVVFKLAILVFKSQHGKTLCTSRMIAISSLTADAIACARPTLSLFRELTLGLETGVFRWRHRKYGTVFLPHCENRTMNLCSSNDF